MKPPPLEWRSADWPGYVETPETHLGFMRDACVELTAVAKRGYSTEGRGAVVVGAAGVAPLDLHSALQIAGKTNTAGMSKAYYLSDVRAQSTGLGWPSEDEEQLVSTYDPNTELVVIFRRIDGGISSYKLDMRQRLVG